MKWGGYLKETVKSVGQLLGQLCVEYVNVLRETGQNPTRRGFIEEAERHPHHPKQHYQMQRDCSP